MAKGKKGQVLLLALMIMFVGAVILTGLFQYLGTSLLLATRGEENAVNYYAADSGIEDAIYWLQHEQEDEDLWAWNVVEEQWERAAYTLNYTNNADNNRAVDVVVKNNPSGCGDNCYSINSTATHNKTGASTTIESYIRATPIEFWKFGKDAITSNCSVEIKSAGGHGNTVQGNVTYGCDVECKDDPKETDECPAEVNCCEQSVNGSMNHDPDGIDWWPETWAIAKYFEDQVNVLKPFTEGSINVAVNSTIGPLYVDGDLDLYSDVDGASASLEGVVYVTGDLTIGGAKAFTLNLSDQVIFVESREAVSIGELPIVSPAAEVLIEGGDHSGCTFAGSGAIFAIGDIWFQPKLSTSSQDFMFVISIEGWLHMQPIGKFYGSLAANTYVDIQPNNSIERTESDDLWDTFFDPEPVILKILTYDIVDR